MMDDIHSVTFVTFVTGEIKICMDGNLPPDDDTLTLQVAARDDGGVYFFAADADRLREFLAQGVPASVPGGRP